MPLAPPATVSPGKLFVDYIGATGIRHSASVNLMSGAMPASRSAAEIMAVDFGEALALAMPQATFTALGWRIAAFFPVDGTWAEVWAGGFLEPLEGWEGPYIGIENAVSVTMTIGGRGNNADAEHLGGQTRLRLYTGPGYVIPAATNRIDIAADGYERLAVLAATLDSAEGYWADVYGQKAVAFSYLAPQVNAHWQRTRGL